MARATSLHARQVFSLGAAITLGVIACDAFGLLNAAERLTWDFRFQNARLRAAPMSDFIRHVDIDDGAISNVGRWPWPRSRIAMAIDEIGRAGAKTVALDLLFSDPDEPTWEEAPAPVGARVESDAAFRRVDHDRALADAFSRTPCVLALNLGARDSLGEAWAGERHQGELRSLLDVLSADISVPEQEAADRAGLTGERKTRFLRSPGAFKSLAAGRESARMLSADPSAQFNDLVKRLAPGVNEYTASFPELPRLERAWDQRRSWLALRPMLRTDALVQDDANAGAPDAAAPQRPTLDADDRAPISIFCEAAAAAGFVDFTADPDGGVRVIPAMRATATGEAIQFGLAAAAEFLDIAPDAVVATPSAITIGNSRLPLTSQGVIMLDYPGSKAGWLEALRRNEGDASGHGHVSIGALIDLAQQREKLESNRRKLAEATRIALGLPPGVPVGEAEISSAVDQGKDRIEELSALMEQGETLDEQERNTLEIFRQQGMLAAEVRAGPGRIADQERQLRDLLGGRLVFVGWTATGAAADFVKTPLGSRTPGVIVHAVSADMAISGRAALPTHAWLAWALAALLGLASAAAVALLAPAASAVVFGALALGYAGVGGVALFNWLPGGTGGASGVMMPIVAPLSAAVAAFFSCTALEAGLAQRDRRRIERQFKARVSGQLVDYLVGNPGALSMSGQQREITSMFIDLAGFTAISERLDGPTTVATLNRCMRDMTTVLTAQGAYVNKFLGDGLMAFWSAFGEDPSQAKRACAAAVACRAAVEAINEDPTMRGMPHLSARIGIATGPVVVGDCGAPPDLNDYTVIGNAVNLAARLESANKTFGTSVLIDGRTRELLGENISGILGARAQELPSGVNGAHAAGADGAAVVPARRTPTTPSEAESAGGYRLRPLGRVIVVGQTRAVEIYELMPPDASPIRIELTARAVELFQRGDYLISLSVWKQLEEEYADQKLAEAYREGAADAEQNAAQGVGALRLRAK